MTSPEIKRIAEVLAEVDAIRTPDGNPDPIGEYAIEAEWMLRCVRLARGGGRAIDQPHMSAIVQEVFRHWFGEDISTTAAEEMAHRLVDLRLA